MNKIAVILGASADRSKFGNKSLRAHLKAGYDVVPVNPRAQEVEGIPAIPSIDRVEGPIDRVSVYLPPALLLRELEAIASKNPAEVWLNPGTESAEVIACGRELNLNLIRGCSIVDLGMSPREFPDT